MGKPNKTLKVGGHATVEIDDTGQTIAITGGEGLTIATVTDLDGNVVYMHHPLTGWYIEMDLRKGGDGELEVTT